jgi:hypothetical protein
MDWIQFCLALIAFLALIGTQAGLFLWTRSETAADRRELHALIQSISVEIKDFHGRLCAIEENRKDRGW